MGPNLLTLCEKAVSRSSNPFTCGSTSTFTRSYNCIWGLGKKTLQWRKEKPELFYTRLRRPRPIPTPQSRGKEKVLTRRGNYPPRPWPAPRGRNTHSPRLKLLPRMSYRRPWRRRNRKNSVLSACARPPQPPDAQGRGQWYLSKKKP